MASSARDEVSAQSIVNVAWAQAKLPKLFEDTAVVAKGGPKAMPLPVAANYVARRAADVAVARKPHDRRMARGLLLFDANEATNLMWSLYEGTRMSQLSSREALAAHDALVGALLSLLDEERTSQAPPSIADVRMCSTALNVLVSWRARGAWSQKETQLASAVCEHVVRVCDFVRKPLVLDHASTLVVSLADIAPYLSGETKHTANEALCASLRTTTRAMRNHGVERKNEAMTCKSLAQLAFAVARRLQTAESNGEPADVLQDEARGMLASVCLLGAEKIRPSPRLAASILWCCGRARAPPTARQGRTLVDVLTRACTIPPTAADSPPPKLRIAFLDITMALVGLSELGWYSNSHASSLDAAAVLLLESGSGAGRTHSSAMCSACHALARVGHTTANLPRATLEHLAATAAESNVPDAAAVAQLAWSLAICGGASDVPPEALAWLRERISEHADGAFSRSELAMVYQLDLTLRLDTSARVAPGVAAAAALAPTASTLESLWYDGRARYAAYCAWARVGGGDGDGDGDRADGAGYLHFSRLHSNVIDTLRRICAPTKGKLSSARVVHEFAAPGGATVDCGGIGARSLVREERFAMGDARFEVSTGFAIDVALLPTPDATRLSYLRWRQCEAAGSAKEECDTAAQDDDATAPWLPRKPWDLKPLAIEVDGPHHYFVCPWQGDGEVLPHPGGATQLKHRLLERSGWTFESVPYYEWDVLSSNDERRAYLADKIRAACDDAWMLNSICRDELSSLEDDEQQRQDAAAKAAAEERRAESTSAAPSAAAALALASAKRRGGVRRELLRKVALERAAKKNGEET
ncbi:hypothetical protein PPROV_000479200 [Pycnococcus provasolii]|uniref:RAP domain-containing protein n=1 Tax=Pycnococcus provasolii TaxID=41880 RepID=A0A830HGM0_9CHLO|nr:hypothetical protein PPROV_000479200 [Pycnococcus provasolii]